MRILWTRAGWETTPIAFGWPVIGSRVLPGHACHLARTCNNSPSANGNIRYFRLQKPAALACRPRYNRRLFSFGARFVPRRVTRTPSAREKPPAGHFQEAGSNCPAGGRCPRTKTGSKIEPARTPLNAGIESHGAPEIGKRPGPGQIEIPAGTTASV